MRQPAIDQTIVYTPDSRSQLGFFQTWAVMISGILGSRELVWQLFKRNFLASYKKSFLGITWLFLSPLFGIVSWVFLQKSGMLNPGDTGIPYPAYVLIGTSMWGLLMGFYSAAKETLASGQALVMQVRYPHEALLFMQTAQHVANFLIAFAMNIVVLVAFGVVPSWKIIFFPLVALPLFFVGAAIGLVVSIISVVSIDIDRAVTMGMGLLMWLTPVVYSTKVPNQVVQTLISFNPLTYLVCSARDIVIYGTLYRPSLYFLCAGAAAAVFLLSWRLFYVSEDKIIERMI